MASSGPVICSPAETDRAALFARFDALFFSFRHRDLLPPGPVPDARALFAIYLAQLRRRSLDPRADFSEQFYLERNPDIRAAVAAGAFLSGFHHWALHGRQEGRPHHPACAADSTQAACKAAVERVFDHRHYADMFMGTADVGHSEALRHFMLNGLGKGIVPVPAGTFDENFYLSFYSDVRAAREAGSIPSGYYHYVTIGRAEQRRPVRAAPDRMQLPRVMRLGAIEDRLRPVPVHLDRARRPAVNVFLPSFDLDAARHGPAHSQDAFWHFLCRLAEQGERLRFVATENSKSSRDWFTYRLGAQPRWLRAFHHQEFADVTDRAQVLACHPRDICLAASAWTMHAAWSVARLLERKEVTFFVQDDETARPDSEAQQFLLRAAYAIPHLAIFDSAALAAYFRHCRLGVFANGGIGRHLCFESALPLARPDPHMLGVPGRKRRLLCHAPPESLDPHGLFEICVMALREAVREGALTGEWDVIGLGAAGLEGEVALGDGRTMRVLGPTGVAEKAALLRSSDVALALLWSGRMGSTVHELAGAGVVTVTNIYPGRSARDLALLGRNVVPCEATPQGIVDGIWEAIGRSADIPARLAASRLDRPASWDDVFDRAFLAEFDAMVRGQSTYDTLSIPLAAE